MAAMAAKIINDQLLCSRPRKHCHVFIATNSALCNNNLFIHAAYYLLLNFSLWCYHAYISFLNYLIYNRTVVLEVVQGSDAGKNFPFQQFQRGSTAGTDEGNLVLHVPLGGSGCGVTTADDAFPSGLG